MDSRWSLLFAFVFAACSPQSESADVDGRDDAFLSDSKADAFGVVEGSPLADGVLLLANTASFAELDHVVRLYRQAAEAIVEHRNGPDGRLGTADDDLIDTLEELDDIPWIGTRAFARLAQYAQDNGYVDRSVGADQETLAAPSVARSRAAVTLLDDGRVFVAGGADADGYLHESAEVFDPSTDTWTPIAPMPHPRSDATATLLDDGRVLVAGGRAPSSVSRYGLKSAIVWDAATDSWSDAGQFQTGRYNHTATKLADGRVVVVGGQESYNTFTVLEVVVYDPSTNAWTTAATTPVGVQEHTATLAPDGSIVVIGGYNRFLRARSRAIMRYDGTDESLSVIGYLRTERSNHSATLVGDRILVAGGSSDGERYEGSAELVDPTTGESRDVAPLLTARYGHSAIALRSGLVAVLGGADERFSEGSHEVDVYDPRTETWGRGEPLFEARQFHHAVATPEGALIVGGATDASENPATILYRSTSLTEVDVPAATVTHDWDLLQNFGEQDVACGANQIVYHEALGQLVCFAGRKSENEPVATYAWDGAGWREIADATSSPTPPRQLHAMAYDSARGRIVVFGGSKRGGYDLDDVWEFDGSTWTEVQPSTAVAPPAQNQGVLVFDSVRGRSLLLPGRTAGTRSTVVYAWDGASWSVVTPAADQVFGAGSGIRYNYAAAFDAARDRVVVFGGRADSPLPTWEFDGSAWTQGPRGGPYAGGYLDATYNPADGAIYTIGVRGRTPTFGDPDGIALWRYDGAAWKVVETEYRFPHHNWNRPIEFHGGRGTLVVGRDDLMELNEHASPNHRPRVTYRGPRSVYANESIELEIEATDEDGHELVVTHTDLPDGATFDPATGVLSWNPRPDQGGQHAVTFSATDGALADSVEAVIEVKGLISYPMLPTGAIDMRASVRMNGTVQERRYGRYVSSGGTFRIDCHFTGTNPGRVEWACDVVKTSRWPYDWTVSAAGQLGPNGSLGSANVMGKVASLPHADHELRLTGFDVRWQSGQERWSARGDFAGYLGPN